MTTVVMERTRTRPMTNDDSRSQSQAMLPDEDACLDSLFRLNLAKLGACPGSHSNKARFYKLKSRKAYICQLCGHKIHPCANTFLRGSSTSLTKWLLAMYLLSITRGTMTTKELAERLEVTYKCAWRIRDRLRFATNGEFPANMVTATHRSTPDYSALLGAFVFAALAAESGRSLVN